MMSRNPSDLRRREPTPLARIISESCTIWLIALAAGADGGGCTTGDLCGAGRAAQNPPDRRLAAAFQLPQLPGLPSLTGPSADWRQFDAFFTFVVKRFGEDVPPALQDSLADAFLDSRYELTSAVAPGQGGDPVPQLFVDGWRRLSPIMNQALPALPNQTASLYSSFIGAADKLATAGGVGLNLTPDALKGMAGIIAPTSTTDPLAYSTNVDGGLRSLLGFGAPLQRRSRLDPVYCPTTAKRRGFPSGVGPWRLRLRRPRATSIKCCPTKKIYSLTWTR